jgi:hypothetical protein
MITVTCVWAGTKYSAEYVARLQKAVSEHLLLEHQLVCFTDQKFPDIPGVEFRKLPVLPFPIVYPWWYKVWLFSPDAKLSGRILFLDLDIMILKNIDKFVSYSGEFLGIRDFTRVQNPAIKTTNSSIMCWDQQKHQDVWERFSNSAELIQKTYPGDQNYISDYLGNRITWWPDTWALSYRWEYLKTGLQKETAVLVFHGRPKPHELDWQLLGG